MLKYPSALRASIVLGCLAALGPFAIDAYLPAMPAMARDLGADAGAVQLTLMSFFVGLTVGQLFYGPLSDRFGRKPLILLGLTLFTVASVACAFATTANALIATRLCQGLGGSIGMAMAIAVVRDLFTGHAAVRLMGLIIGVMGVAPVVAPLLGYLVLALAKWNGIFVALALFGALDIALVAFALPETRLPELRTKTSPIRVAALYWSLVTSRRSIPYLLSLAATQAGFFAFIAGSPEVFVSHFGLPPSVYSLLFAVDAAALAVAGRLNAHAVRRWNYRAVMTTALAVSFLAACVMVLASRLGLASWQLVAGATFVVMTSTGFVIPSLNTLMVESYGAVAGTAAAVIGAFQFLSGALSSAALGRLSDGTPNPMASIIALCGGAALILVGFTFAAAARRMGKSEALSADVAPERSA